MACFCPLLLRLRLLRLLLLLADVPPFLACRVCSTWTIYIYTLRGFYELTQAWSIISVSVPNTLQSFLSGDFLGFGSNLLVIIN